MGIKETNMKYETKLPQKFLDDIDVGLKAVEDGRVIPHDEAMRQIRAELGFEEI